MTVFEWARAAARTLSAAGVEPETARRDVAALARGVLGWDLGAWVSRQPDPLSSELGGRLDALVARRARHEPIAYLTGWREFYGRQFHVTPAVLIPRPETELAVEVATQLLTDHRVAGPSPRVLDVGTGSGAIAITLALEHPSARVSATDVSEAALAVARSNAARLGVGDRVSFLHASLVGDAREVDLIVSNPPYVARQDAPSLQPDVYHFEPHVALFGGADGLAVIRDLLPATRAALAPGGWLVLEIGAGQDRDARRLIVANGLEWWRTEADLAGHPRIVVARRGGESL